MFKINVKNIIIALSLVLAIAGSIIMYSMGHVPSSYIKTSYSVTSTSAYTGGYDVRVNAIYKDTAGQSYPFYFVTEGSSNNATNGYGNNYVLYYNPDQPSTYKLGNPPPFAANFIFFAIPIFWIVVFNIKKIISKLRSRT